MPSLRNIVLFNLALLALPATIRLNGIRSSAAYTTAAPPGTPTLDSAGTRTTRLEEADSRLRHCSVVSWKMSASHF